MSWFRMYDGVLDDPKVQRLPSEFFKGWVNLLCLAKRNNGQIPGLEDVAFALRLDLDGASTLLETLVSAGLFDDRDGILYPHNWEGRQYKSDVSTERVKRFRGRSMKRDETVSETPDETPPEQNRTESETEQKESSAPDGAPPISEIDKAFFNYNVVADEHGLPQAVKLTADRRRKLSARLKEHGLAGWNRALESVGVTPFLCGKNERMWKADLDFFLQPESFNRVLEGYYRTRA